MCVGEDNNKPLCIHTPLQKESTSSVSRCTHCAGTVLFTDWGSVVALCTVSERALQACLGHALCRHCILQTEAPWRPCAQSVCRHCFPAVLAQFVCLGLFLVICPIFLTRSLLIYLLWWPVIMVTFEVSTTAHWRLRWGLAFFRSKIFFWLHHAACGVLVPWPGIEPVPSAVKAWSPNHWTANKSQQ